MSDFQTELNRVLRYEAGEGDLNNLLHQLASNPEHQAPGSNLRLVAADALQENGQEIAAEQLRSNLPLRGYTHQGGQNLYIEHQNDPYEHPTHYYLGTPPEVIKVLEQARRNGTRLHISNGHTRGDKAGLDWLSSFESHGTVGRSFGGNIRTPLLINNRRSTGGGSISTASVVRIRETPSGRVLYQHPKYTHGELLVSVNPKPQKYRNKTFPYEVHRDGTNVANFESLDKALRWAKKLGVKVTLPEEKK